MTSVTQVAAAAAVIQQLDVVTQALAVLATPGPYNMSIGTGSDAGACGTFALSAASVASLTADLLAIQKALNTSLPTFGVTASAV